MINLFKTILTLFLLSSFTLMNAQSYCVEFSKEKRKTVSISDNKKVSFMLIDNENWDRGVITRISSDSVFIEQRIPRKNILKERTSNYEINGYALGDFKILAYPKTSSVVRGTTIVLLLATVVVAAAAVGGGAGLAGVGEGFDNEPAQKKFFKKNIDFEGGWSAEIVPCKQ